MLFSQFPLTFKQIKQTQNKKSYFIAWPMTILVLIRDHLRDVPWEHLFKLDTSAGASEFCEWVQVGIDVFIPHCKYQV